MRCRLCRNILLKYLDKIRLNYPNFDIILSASSEDTANYISYHYAKYKW